MAIDLDLNFHAIKNACTLLAFPEIVLFSTGIEQCLVHYNSQGQHVKDRFQSVYHIVVLSLGLCGHSSVSGSLKIILDAH